MSREYSGKKIEGKEKIEREYAPFLTDEARITPAVPDILYFPETTEQVAEAVRQCTKEDRAYTVSGGRTGIGGGAVPSEKTTAIISLERVQPAVSIQWNEQFSAWTAAVGAGLKLQDFLNILKQKRYSTESDEPDGLFFPVDPTETSATLGGMAATNASGARTLYYGAMRKWVLGLTVVLSDGNILKLKRGRNICTDGYISFKDFPGGLEIPITPVSIPRTKHTAGYFLTDQSDAVDLFIGSEGTLGIITEIELRLTVPGKYNLYSTLFLQADEPTDVVTSLINDAEFPPIALEYMDSASLTLLRQFRQEQGEASGVPNLPRDTQAVIYSEYNFSTKEGMETGAERIGDLLKKIGISPDTTWAGFSSKTLAAMKAFRHALPERVNSIIAARKQTIPTLTKIGTDMAVPLQHLPSMLEEYRAVLSENDLEYCIFGHIGNGHVHVNMLPKTEEEMNKGWEIYTLLAHSVREKEGSICAEHGIGRLKRKLLRVQFTNLEIEAMKRVKTILDPDNRLNPDVLFPEE